MSAHLSPELRAKYGTRSFPVRTGDTVLIMRGDFKGVTGKVVRVDRKRLRVYVEGVTRRKVDGTTVLVPIHVSNVMITKLDLSDPWRKRKLEALEKRAAERATEEAEEERSEEKGGE